MRFAPDPATYTIPCSNAQCENDATFVAQAGGGQLPVCSLCAEAMEILDFLAKTGLAMVHIDDLTSEEFLLLVPFEDLEEEDLKIVEALRKEEGRKPGMSQSMTDREYRQHGGEICPNCQHEVVEGESVEVDGNVATQERRCSACGATWVGVYHLVGYADLAPSDPAKGEL